MTPLTDAERAFGDDLVRTDRAELPDKFFDRLMFNLHAQDGRAPSVLLGLGVYPRKDVVDGFVVLVTDTEQRNLQFSTELSATDGRSAGPFAFEVLEPMRAWRLVVGANPTGVELDVVWRARTPAWWGQVEVRNASAASTSFDHLFQSGRYRGSLVVDGVVHDVDGWYGQRDRSRGVRTMSGGQGLHIWLQAQFPDRCIGLLTVENRSQERLLIEGAVMHEDGKLDLIASVRHDLRFRDGHDLEGGVVEVTTAAGRVYRLDCDASGRGGYMAGAGYGGHHGKALGRDHLEASTYALDGSVTPDVLDSALTDRLCTFHWGEVAGSGIFEFAHSRSNQYTYRPTLT